MLVYDEFHHLLDESLSTLIFSFGIVATALCLLFALSTLREMGENIQE